MYLVLFSPMICAVVGAAVAAALVYEYYVSKQSERESSVEHRAYSTLQSEPFEKNSANRIDLRRRKHRTEVNQKTRNENSKRPFNSNRHGMKVEDYLACDNKVLGDVIRNSECNEKRYEKDVFNKVKNDLTNFNQNFEEKEFSGKIIDDSLCVNCAYEPTKTINSVKSNPLVTVGKTQEHCICNQVTFPNSLENLKRVTTYSDRRHDESEIKKSNIFCPNCSDEVVNIAENHQSPKTVTDNDCEAYSGRPHDECEIKKSNIFRPDCSDEVVNNSENHQSLQTVKDNEYEFKSCIHFKRNALYINPSQKFDKQQLNIIDASNKHFGNACKKVFKNDDIYFHDRQKIHCKDSKWKETKVLNNSCYENSYLSCVVYNKNFTEQESVKCNFDNMLCDDAFSQKCISSGKAEKMSLNSDYQSQLPFNTVTETSQQINCKKYPDMDTKLNVIPRNSKHVENMLNSSIYAINQHAAVNFMEFPKSPSYWWTAKNKLPMPRKEKGFEIFGYNQANGQGKVLGISSLSIISHLHHNFMPGFQSYISSIKNFVKEHKEMALYIQSNNSDNENTSITENDAEISEAENVDIGIQIGSTFDSENEELNNPTSEPHSTICKGCMEVFANTVSVPCGHSYFCNKCAEMTSKIYKKCCICHNHVTSFKLMIV